MFFRVDSYQNWEFLEELMDTSARVVLTETCPSLSFFFKNFWAIFLAILGFTIGFRKMRISKIFGKSCEFLVVRIPFSSQWWNYWRLPGTCILRCILASFFCFSLWCFALTDRGVETAVSSCLPSMSYHYILL